VWEQGDPWGGRGYAYEKINQREETQKMKGDVWGGERPWGTIVTWGAGRKTKCSMGDDDWGATKGTEKN